MVMEFFEGARGRLHCRRWPVTHPIAGLALLPGIGQHSGHYHRFARGLGAAGIQAWVLDTAGQGLSEGDPERPGTLPELVDDAMRFVEVVRTEHPRTPLTLMGHSLGAVTALGALGCAIPTNPVNAANTAANPSASRAEYPLTPALDHTLLAGLVLCGVPERALGAGTPNAPGPGLPHELPVLAVHGVDDRRAPISAIRLWTRRHQWVDLREYADAGHDLLHEPVHPRVCADIAEFARGVATQSAAHR